MVILSKTVIASALCLGGICYGLIRDPKGDDIIAIHVRLCNGHLCSLVKASRNLMSRIRSAIRMFYNLVPDRRADQGEADDKNHPIT